MEPVIAGPAALWAPLAERDIASATLMQRSTVLADAKASGALKLVVGCFQLNTGVVSLIE